MRIALAALLLLPLPALAQQPDLLVGGLGATDALRGDRSGVDVRLDYRPGISLLPVLQEYFVVRPWVGAEPTSRGSVWGGGGVLLDIGVGRFALVPSVGVGGYHRGNGKDLGNVLEFRSAVELQYKFEDQSRVGLGISHISNAGTTPRNPGTEAIFFNYQVPLNRLFGP